MKHYYFLTLLSFFVITSQGQEKSAWPIHISKEPLATFKITTSDKKASEATEKEKPLEEAPEHFINFNPVMHFGDQHSPVELSRQVGDLSKASVFTVYRSGVKLVERPIWEVYGERSYIKLTTQKVAHSGRETRYEGGNTNRPVLSSYTHYYKPESATAQEQRIVLGGSLEENAFPFKGDIAEIIVYNKVLRGDALQKTESALALKYGITLKNGKNYIDSEGEVTWNIKEYKAFNHHIAGIGRDDQAKLYQKQAHSTSDPGLLIIGAGDIALTNAENTASFENGNFLVWGDNNLPLILEPGEQVQDRASLLQRSWLMQRTGDQAKAIPTTVQLDINSLFEKLEDPGQYLLVIDQSGSGDFLIENTRYIPADALLENGKIEFKNIQWDKDGSGADLFSFTMISDLKAELVATAPESCDALYNGVLHYEVSGGVPPYTYTLSGEEAGYNEQWESTEERYPDNRIEELAGGDHEFTVTDAMGHKVTAVYTLENPVPLTVDLGPDRRLSPQQPLYLDASFGHPQGTTYRWSSDSGFSSEDGGIHINKPGRYQVTATSPLGCMASDEIIISEQLIESFSLYPNQSEDGNYTLGVFLEENADVIVHVFDMTGRLLDTMEGKNQMSYEFSGHIASGAGIYTIVVETRGETASRKLIVK